MSPNWFLNMSSPILDVPLKLFFPSVLIGKSEDVVRKVCYDRICTKTLTTRAPPEQPLYRYVTRLRAVPSSEIIFPLIFVVKLFFVVQNFGRVKFAGERGRGREISPALQFRPPEILHNEK